MSDFLDDRRKALEEEYFHRKEQEDLKKLREKLDAEKKDDEDESWSPTAPVGEQSPPSPEAAGSIADVINDDDPTKDNDER